MRANKFSENMTKHFDKANTRILSDLKKLLCSIHKRYAYGVDHMTLRLDDTTKYGFDLCVVNTADFASNTEEVEKLEKKLHRVFRKALDLVDLRLLGVVLNDRTVTINAEGITLN